MPLRRFIAYNNGLIAEAHIHFGLDDDIRLMRFLARRTAPIEIYAAAITASPPPLRVRLDYFFL